ncbi:MAG: Rnf-Nqr domain containing protein [Oscillospiraceae bacterium]
MAEKIMEFIFIMLAAITFENAIFTRALGVNQIIFRIKDVKSVLIFGSIITGVLTISNIINYFLNQTFTYFLVPNYIKYTLFVISIIFAFVIISFVTKKLYPEKYNNLKIMLTMASFNCCIQGVLIISVLQKLSLVMSIAYALGSGIGFTIALLMIYIGKERISMLNVPKAFKGLPIMLLYIGILSLAIYGLIGHQLPS